MVWICLFPCPKLSESILSWFCRCSWYFCVFRQSTLFDQLLCCVADKPFFWLASAYLGSCEWEWVLHKKYLWLPQVEMENVILASWYVSLQRKDIIEPWPDWMFTLINNQLQILVVVTTFPFFHHLGERKVIYIFYLFQLCISKQLIYISVAMQSLWHNEITTLNGW